LKFTSSDDLGFNVEAGESADEIPDEEIHGKKVSFPAIF
jgi:hypothetical protein